MTYRLLDHTGDLGIEVTAPSLNELFGECLRAQTDCLTRVDRVEAREARAWALSAPDLPGLLVEFLNESIFLFETEGIALGRAEVRIERTGSDWLLVGEVMGEPFDLARHGLRTLLKAVTYHQLVVRQDDDAWLARVIFDI